jgi:NAD(P)-dependent dehydrogenase (short-subunit alcohol dehydrogenase family)
MSVEPRNEVVVIAGGAGGIGASCARLFAQNGWSVVVADIDEEAAETIAAEVGGTACELDLASLDSIRTLTERVRSEFGRVDALVNSAAWFHKAGPAEELTEEDWDRTFTVCAKGPYFLSVDMALLMVETGGGSIVNLASTAGVRSAPLHAYAPAKAALINMTECLSAEFGRSGVRVNTVTPSLTRTPALTNSIAARERFADGVERFTVLGRLVEPAEVAEAVFFLASSESSAITGVNIPVDGGSLLTSSWEMFGGLRMPEQQ